MTESRQEEYARKIAALLAKAESTTPQEAELLLQKAAELMEKYRIDQAMIDAAAGKRTQTNDPIVQEEFVAVGIWRFPIGLMMRLALQHNGIQTVKLIDPGWREIGGKVYKQTEVRSAVGYKSDIDRVRMLLTSLQIQMMRAELAWWDEYSYLYSHESNSKQHVARRGFMFGFAQGAGEKIKAGIDAGRKTAEAEHGSDSVALVLRPRELMVKDEFQKLFPSLRNVKDRKNHGDDFARGKGWVAGQRSDTGGSKLGGSKQQLNS